MQVPRAAVNVKPNLQIVADDVKCTHGCAVSDLEEAQLFYFRCGFEPRRLQDCCSDTDSSNNTLCCTWPGMHLSSKRPPMP